jgi:hypothetical protein
MKLFEENLHAPGRVRRKVPTQDPKIKPVNWT